MFDYAPRVIRNVLPLIYAAEKHSNPQFTGYVGVYEFGTRPL